jgi:hypothetical protein
VRRLRSAIVVQRMIAHVSSESYSGAPVNRLRAGSTETARWAPFRVNAAPSRAHAAPFPAQAAPFRVNVRRFFECPRGYRDPFSGKLCPVTPKNEDPQEGILPPSALPPEIPGTLPPRISVVREVGGREGPEPTRYGDWELRGRCIDF